MSSRSLYPCTPTYGETSIAGVTHDGHPFAIVAIFGPTPPRGEIVYWRTPYAFVEQVGLSDFLVIPLAELDGNSQAKMPDELWEAIFLSRVVYRLPPETVRIARQRSFRATAAAAAMKYPWQKKQKGLPIGSRDMFTPQGLLEHFTGGSVLNGVL